LAVYYFWKVFKERRNRNAPTPREVRGEEGLNGLIPADKAGIKVEGDDNWLTMIQNASHKAGEEGSS
jgi:hypothetical protein